MLDIEARVEHRVWQAIAEVAAGRPVVVVDDADRENEGDLVFAASCATPALVALMVRHTSGFICVALPADECDRLALPAMPGAGDGFGTAYRVSVDARGVGTGISATDRSRTIAALASPDTAPGDLVRPGHVVPLQARPRGLLDRPGHTEAAVDLARLAGLSPVGALCEIVSVERPGEMARGDELRRFAAEHQLALVTVGELIAHRRATEPQVRRAATTSLPTDHGFFRAVGYEDVHGGGQHMALVAGRVDDGDDIPVHVHVECLTGDVMGSVLCDCGDALKDAMSTITACGRGVIVYLRPSGPVRACGLWGRSDAVGTSTTDWILADLGVRTTRPARDVVAAAVGDLGRLAG